MPRTPPPPPPPPPPPRTGPTVTSQSVVQEPDRLQGWKDIATFVGKGVRTAQRWEKQFGLPVHRIGEDGGEIVFASRREIEAWLATAERAKDEPAVAQREEADTAADALSPDAHPPTGVSTPVSAAPVVFAGGLASPAIGDVRPRRRWPVLATAAAAVILVVVTGLALTVEAPRSDGVTAAAGPGASQPHHWEVDGRIFRVFGRDGQLAWEYEFERELNPKAYEPGGDRHSEQRVVIQDLDGDGSREVLFVYLGERISAGSRLTCFHADGSVRFEHRPSPTVRFGDRDYPPPWVAAYIVVTTDPTGRKDVWLVSFHVPWFPSSLERIDPVTGKVASTYWSNGYITSVDRIEWRGRPWLAVGATNNESKGASLALLPADHESGAAPAANDNYRCTTCPPGGPEIFLVFPRSCMRVAGNGQAVVTQVRVDGFGRLVVYASQAGGDAPEPGLPPDATVLYTLDEHLRLIELDSTPQFDLLHERARKAGIVDHDRGAVDEQWLLPVRRWDGSKYVELNRAPFRH
jgi:hypothetical protein